MRWGMVALVALTPTMGCSSTVTTVGAGGSGGTATAGGTGGIPGGGGDGASDGGGGGTGSDCPDIGCDKTCPAGQWLDAAGCPTCACASELEMSVQGDPRDAQHLVFSGAVTEFIGGIDRWIFDFTWMYDDPNLDGDAEEVVVQVALARIDRSGEPTEAYATWCHPNGSERAYEPRQGMYTLYAGGVVGVISNDLTIADGFLSVRSTDQQQFEGYAYFDLISDTVATTVHVAAPFTLALPAP